MNVDYFIHSFFGLTRLLSVQCIFSQLFNLLQSVLEMWQMREFVAWERQWCTSIYRNAATIVISSNHYNNKNLSNDGNHSSDRNRSTVIF
jgi:hypothetical protein